MQLKALLALAALTNAAVLPRGDDVYDNLLPKPYPLDEKTARIFAIPKPQEVFWSAKDLLKAGNDTEAPFLRPSTKATADSVLPGRDVHGADDRFLQTSLSYPYVAMGRVRITWDNVASWCSGSLVGPRVVAMARHCLHAGASYSFSPAYYNGDRLPTSNVILTISLAGTVTTNCDYRDDWVLLILSNSLAATSGYLGARNWDNALANQNVFNTYGYPQDKSATGQLPYAHNGFSAWLPGGCSNGGPVYHLGDSSPGQSGSAVYRNEAAGPYQYGVHVASNAANGLWAHGPSFVNAIVSARTNYP